MKFAHLCRPKSGESLCGDAVGIFGTEANRLFAVLDGLGHGPEANEACQKALEFIGPAWEEDLETIIWGSHEHVRDTRGLALFLCRFSDGEKKLLECAGIGNVEFKAFGDSTIAPFPRDGVVGHRVRKVSSFHYGYGEGGTFAVFTDGIHASFNLANVAHLEPPQAAQDILEKYGKDYDDATILLVRT